MIKEEIHLQDIGRMIMGEIPADFLIEVIIRIVFLFLLLLFAMRFMGRRMASTLNRNELAALVALAAAIGVPMQSPDRGLLPAVLIAFVIIAVQRTIAALAANNKKFEQISQDSFDVLVKDGELNMASLKKTGLSRERVFAELRAEGIDNLGQVERLYIESSGKFNLFKQENPKPGLSIILEWDRDFNQK